MLWDWLMGTFRISSDLIERAMQSQPVRDSLASRARTIASRADSLGASEDVEINARVVEGTRPKGRPYANVESDNVGQEWGSRYTERRRILGRAAGL